MHEPIRKRKPSSEINIYREACRNRIASDPRLQPGHKVVLMRLTEYVNRNTWDTFVSQAKLATDCHLTVRTVERAISAGMRFGIIERTFRGHNGIGPNHYVFKLKTPAIPEKVTRPARQSYPTGVTELPDRDVGLTTEEHLINLTCKEGMGMEVKEAGKESGEVVRPTPSPTPLGEPRLDINLFRAEMAHRRLLADWEALYRNPVVQTALIGL